MPFKRAGFGAMLGAALCVYKVLSSEPSRSAPGLTDVDLGDRVRTLVVGHAGSLCLVAGI